MTTLRGWGRQVLREQLQWAICHTCPHASGRIGTGWQSGTYATASLLVMARTKGTPSLRSSEFDSE